MRHAFADCLLDTETLTLTRAGTSVPVEPQVFDLLRLLVENAGRVVTRDEIVKRVWGGRIVSESAISARIAAARKAVGCDGKAQSVIRTVARRGLQLAAEVRNGADRDAAAAPDTAAPKRGSDAPPRVRYARNPSGHVLAWSITGSGPPVVRIGAPLVVLSNQWTLPSERVLIGALSARHGLVHFDRSGFGLSAAPDAPFDHRLMVADTIAVADAAGLDRFALFSETGASLIAVRTAALYPDRVSRLVLVGGYVDGRSRRGPAPPPDPIRGLLEEGWGKTGGSLAFAFMFSYFPEGPLEVVRQIVEAEQRASTEEMILKLRDAVNHDSIAEYLPRVRCPTLIEQGRDNAVHPLSEARKLAAGIPGSELVVLDTANHVPLPGNTVWPTYIETLLAFLAEDAPEGEG